MQPLSATWNIRNRVRSSQDEHGNYVFGYGSLMEEWLDEGTACLANLAGFERNWLATMDNRLSIPGYKIYEPLPDAQRPDFVSFLNISRTRGSKPLTGVIRRYSLTELAELDRRERNYLRIEVTRHVRFICGAQGKPNAPYTIWTYTASVAARERHRASHGKSVVSQAYYEGFCSAAERIKARVHDPARINFDVSEPPSKQALMKLPVGD
jgi:hypothetical protein